MVNPISRNQLPQEATTKERACRFIARAFMVSLVALAIFATVAVSVPSAWAPAWLMGAAMFFESLAAPSLLGAVISVKAVVYCLGGLTILLAGEIGFAAATDKPKAPAQVENVRRNPVPNKKQVLPSEHSKSSEPLISASSSQSRSMLQEEDYNDPLLADIVSDDSPAPSLGRPEFVGERPITPFYSSGKPLKRMSTPAPAREGLHIGRRI